MNNDIHSDCFNLINKNDRHLINQLIQRHIDDDRPNLLVREADFVWGGKLTDCIVREWKHAKGITVY